MGDFCQIAPVKGRKLKKGKEDGITGQQIGADSKSSSY
jgi:hypothetical protein